jgi:hypothetical protein
VTLYTAKGGILASGKTSFAADSSTKEVLPGIRPG